MGHPRINRIDLAVESLRQAENFYGSLFRMPVEYRECSVGGQVQRIGLEVTWEDVERRELRPYRTVLGFPGFQIALRRASAEFANRSRLEQVALRVESAEISRLACAADDLGCEFSTRENGRLVFRDPYGICWEAAITPSDAHPRV